MKYWKFDIGSYMPAGRNLILEIPVLQGGQALINLVFFVAIGIIFISAATIIILTNSLNASKVEQGTNAYYIAESGAEDALLKLLRNPNYTTSSAVLNVGNGSATIQVSSTLPKTIVSQGRLGNFQRKIQVITNLNNGILEVSSWKEIY